MPIVEEERRQRRDGRGRGGVRSGRRRHGGFLLFDAVVYAEFGVIASTRSEGHGGFILFDAVVIASSAVVIASCLCYERIFYDGVDAS